MTQKKKAIAGQWTLQMLGSLLYLEASPSYADFFT